MDDRTKAVFCESIGNPAGNSLGGAIVDGGRFSWVDNADRYPMFTTPEPSYHGVVYTDALGPAAYIGRARTVPGGRASGIMTFGVHGGFDAGVKFYDALKLFKRLVNIGDAKSLACHPASTTHRQLSEAEQESVGVRPEMIRLSVGIEHIDDIIEDLDQALA